MSTAKLYPNQLKFLPLKRFNSLPNNLSVQVSLSRRRNGGKKNLLIASLLRLITLI